MNIYIQTQGINQNDLSNRFYLLFLMSENSEVGRRLLKSMLSYKSPMSVE